MASIANVNAAGTVLIFVLTVSKHYYSYTHIDHIHPLRVGYFSERNLGYRTHAPRYVEVKSIEECTMKYVACEILSKTIVVREQG